MQSVAFSPSLDNICLLYDQKNYDLSLYFDMYGLHVIIENWLLSA